jgi:hypothetical protein
MERVVNLLRGNYWVIDLQKFKVSDLELNFLSYFFDIKFDKFMFDELNLQEKVYLILKKKEKFIYH